MGDHLQVGKPPLCVTIHPGQLSLLPLVGGEVSTSQCAMMLCGLGVKTGMAHSICGYTCGAQVNNCVTLEMSPL